MSVWSSQEIDKRCKLTIMNMHYNPQQHNQDYDSVRVQGSHTEISAQIDERAEGWERIWISSIRRSIIIINKRDLSEYVVVLRRRRSFVSKEEILTIRWVVSIMRRSTTISDRTTKIACRTSMLKFIESVDSNCQSDNNEEIRNVVYYE